VAEDFSQFQPAGEDFSQFNSISTIGASEPEEARIPVTERVRLEKESVRGQLGKNVDFDTGGPAGMRADLAMSETLEEKDNKLKKFYHKGGEIKEVSTGVQGTPDSELYYRETPNGAWKRLDPPDPELADIAEIVGGYGAEVAGSLWGGGSASLPVAGIKAGLGIMAGHLAKEGVEEYRGTQLQPKEQVAKETATLGALGATGGVVGGLATRGASSIGGRGAFRMDEQQLSKTRALRDVGSHPTPGQISKSPAIQQAEAIAGRLGSAVKTHVEKQERIIHDYANESIKQLGGLSKVEASRKIRNDIGPRILEGTKAQLKAIEDDLVPSKVTKRGAGLELQRVGYPEFKKRLYKTKEALYTTLKSAADEAGESLNVKVSNLKSSTKSLADRVYGKTVEGGDVALDAPLTSETKKLISDIGSLSETQSLDAIRALRTTASDLAFVEKGMQATNSQRVAMKVLNKIDGALDNDISIGNADILRMYRRANTYYRARSKELQKIAIRKIAKTEKPESLINDFAVPNNPSALFTLRNSMPAKSWFKFKQAFNTQIVDKPQNITKHLNSFDSETLNILLTKSEQRAFKTYGKSVDDLAKTPLSKIVEREMDVGKVINTHMTEGNVGAFSDLMKQLGGVNSEGGKVLRNGFMANVLRGAEVKTPDGFTISGSKLAGKVQKLRSSGALAEIPKQDVKRLETLVDALQVIEAKSSGAGLVGAGIVGKMLRAPFEAGGKLLYYSALARAMTSDKMSMLLFGSGKKQITSASIENAAKVLTIFHKDILTSGEALADKYEDQIEKALR